MDLNKGNGMNQNTEMGNNQMNMQTPNMGNMAYQQQNMGMNNMGMNNMGMNNMGMGTMQSAPVTYNNVLDKKGALNINLMIYVLIATLLFITGQNSSLMLLFLAAVIVEKDTDLTKTLATFVVYSLGLYAVYSVLFTVLSPISSTVVSIMTDAEYGSFLYNTFSALSGAISGIKNLLGLVYDVAQIAVGALMFMNIYKGKFKTHKLLDKFI